LLKFYIKLERLIGVELLKLTNLGFSILNAIYFKFID